MSKQKIGYIVAGCFLLLALLGYGCSNITVTKKQPANTESGTTGTTTSVTTTVTTVSSAKYDRRNPGGTTEVVTEQTNEQPEVTTTTKEVVTTTTSRKYDRRNPDAAMEPYTTTTTSVPTSETPTEAVDMVTVDAEIVAVAEDDKSSTGYSLTIKILEGDDKDSFVSYAIAKSAIAKYTAGQKVRVTYGQKDKEVIAVI